MPRKGAAKAKKGSAGGAGSSARAMTLTEVAKRTSISMPTLQKYKKRYSDRIPSVGKGRSQRYPEESLAVFKQLREENMARRGRPRKDGSPAGSGPSRRRGRPARPARSVRRGRPPGASRRGRPPGTSRRGGPRKAAAVGGEGLLTLTQIQQRTKISYPTLLRYVKMALDRIPHVGSGRRRRFKHDAIEVFQKLRGESRRGRPPGAKSARRGRPPGGARRGRPPGSGPAASGAVVSRLLGLVQKLERRLARVESELKKPLSVVRR